MMCKQPLIRRPALDSLALFVMLLIMFWLTACAAADAGPGAAISVPILQADRTPEQVVAVFLVAWRDQDYSTMYAQLSSQSQGVYTLPVFQATYEGVVETVGLSDLRFTIRDTQIQGAAAAVTYDLTLVSPVFGTIDDPGRIMRLIKKPDGWGVAWSNMDIFDGLASGARLEVVARRQPRANIYDRSGQLLVEQGGTVVSLYVAQENMPNVNDCLDLLASVLMRQRYELAAVFRNNFPETVFYVGEIGADVNAARGAELDSICAVRRFEGTTRRYVGSGAAGHVTGYIGPIPADQLQRWQNAGYNSGDLIGLTGVESVYERELAGQAEQVLRIVAPSGLILRELAGRQGTDPLPVTLTLDRDLQLAAAQALADAYNYAEPNWAAPGISPGAGLVVLDVNTGAILALASFPFFDPSVFNPEGLVPDRGALINGYASSTRQPFKNRVTQEQYFPGSVFKIVTTVAAVNEGLVGPDTDFFCDLTWDGRPFGDTLASRADWRRTDELPAAGDVTPPQALAASCNPFFYQMGARLFNERGANTLLDYARRLGLGVTTGVEPIMPEVAGSITQPTSVEQAINDAIGQGEVQVTVIQMARLTAAIANGGTVYRPFVIQQVGGLDGTTPVFQGQPTIIGQAELNQVTLDVVRSGMCSATTNTDIGTAWFVFEETDYTVCGKTGTAQSGQVAPHGWFVAFAPADNPQIAIAAVGEFSREGSEVPAPIVRRILDAYFGQPPVDFPDWWSGGPYVPLQIPVGETGG